MAHTRWERFQQKINEILASGGYPEMVVDARDAVIDLTSSTCPTCGADLTAREEAGTVA